MTEPSALSDVEAARANAAAVGLELDDTRAAQLAAALERYRGQVTRLDRLDLDAHDPGLADPAADR